MRRGFTLFEIAVSLALIALACSTVLLLLPQAYRTQEKARAQIIASARVLDMMELFNTQAPIEGSASSEICPQQNPRPYNDGTRTLQAMVGNPWDCAHAYSVRSMDIDQRVVMSNGGLLPLPAVIAGRLDSDDDEIQRLLDAGGQLYYSKPRPSTGQAVGTASQYTAPENQRLVVGIVGHAQLNAMHGLPWKQHPYYIPYPSPPDASPEQMLDPDVRLLASCSLDPRDLTVFDRAPPPPPIPSALPDFDDRDWISQPSKKVHDGYLAGWWPYSSGLYMKAKTEPPATDPSKNLRESAAPAREEDAMRYAALGYWYARLGVDANELPRVFLDGGDANEADIEAALHLDQPVASQADVAKRGRNVRRLRFLAHAMGCLTRVFTAERKVLKPVYSAAATPGFPAASDVVSWVEYDDGTGFHPPDLLKGVVLAGTIFKPAEALDAAQGYKAKVLRTQTPFVDAAAADRPLHLPDVIATPRRAGYTSRRRPMYEPESRVAYAFRGGARAGETILTPEGTFPRVTHDMIINYHRNAMRLAMKWAACFPNDLSEPRPMNRAIFTDFPLLQWDVLDANPLTGTITGTSVTATQWRPIAPVDLRDPRIGAPVGFQRSFPAVTAALTTGTPTRGSKSFLGPGEAVGSRTPDEVYVVPWGESSHHTLTRRFSPDERARMVVVWSVDWQSYEDFETAPGAPVDASRAPLSVPMPWFWDNWFIDPDFARNCLSWDQRRYYAPWSRAMSYRNPERELAFLCDMDENHPDPAKRTFRETGVDVSTRIAGDDRMVRYGDPAFRSVGSSSRYNFRPDQRPDNPAWNAEDINFPDLTEIDPRMIFSVCYGADRNDNGILDRGPVKRAQRLRATTVAKFVIYDPRLQMTLR